jgi:hypothetical protein
MIDNLSQETGIPNVDYEMDTTGCSIHCVRDFIQRRAYKIFEDRGGLPNHELDDWLQAEREVKYHFGL